MKKLFLLFALVTMLATSCTYKFVEPEVEDLPNPTDTISFSADVLPIFNTGNYCTSCHKAGATSPDLTTANAYNQITTLGLISTADAAQSPIYYEPAPISSGHNWKKYTEAQAQTVLLWITQGANNN